MSKYVEVRHLNASQQFALILDTPDGIDVIGVSPQGREWEAWIDGRPAAQRDSLEKVTSTLGPHLSVEKPALLTPDLREEFQSLAERVRLTKGKLSAPTIVN